MTINYFWQPISKMDQLSQRALFDARQRRGESIEPPQFILIGSKVFAGEYAPVGCRLGGTEPRLLGMSLQSNTGYAYTELECIDTKVYYPEPDSETWFVPFRSYTVLIDNEIQVEISQEIALQHFGKDYYEPPQMFEIGLRVPIYIRDYRLPVDLYVQSTGRADRMSASRLFEWYERVYALEFEQQPIGLVNERTLSILQQYDCKTILTIQIRAHSMRPVFRLCGTSLVIPVEPDTALNMIEFCDSYLPPDYQGAFYPGQVFRGQYNNQPVLATLIRPVGALSPNWIVYYLVDGQTRRARVPESVIRSMIRQQENR